MNPTLEPYVKKLLDGGMKTAEEVAPFIEKQTPELDKANNDNSNESS